MKSVGKRCSRVSVTFAGDDDVVQHIVSVEDRQKGLSAIVIYTVYIRKAEIEKKWLAYLVVSKFCQYKTFKLTSDLTTR